LEWAGSAGLGGFAGGNGRAAGGIYDDPGAERRGKDRRDMARVADGGAGHMGAVVVFAYRDRDGLPGLRQLEVVISGAGPRARRRAGELHG
jgi:hypothetical protein